MTKEQYYETMKAFVEGYGFEVHISEYFGFVIRDPQEEVGVTLITGDWEYIDDEYRKVKVTPTVKAFVRKSGGNPTPEDLMKTAARIAQAATMVKVINAMGLTYTVER